MLLKIFLTFFYLVCNIQIFSQLQIDKCYFHYDGPGETSLCGSGYIFYDSIGFFHAGCENHHRYISAFKYSIDSNKVETEIIPYIYFSPVRKTIVRSVTGLKDSIKVFVFEYSGQQVPAEIAIIRLKRKKDKILQTFYGYKGYATFKRPKNKKLVWTIEGLYPLFFAEVRFNINDEFNYFELYINLPHECLMKTEGKTWASGENKFIIQNPKLISGHTDYSLF